MKFQYSSSACQKAYLVRNPIYRFSNLEAHFELCFFLQIRDFSFGSIFPVVKVCSLDDVKIEDDLIQVGI